MAEHVAVDGMNIPNIPGATERQAPSQANMQPGWVPNPGTPDAPAQPAGLSAEDVKAQIAEAMAKAAPQPAQVDTTPAPFDFAEDMGNDPVLASLNGILASTAPGLDLERAIGKALQYGRADLIDTAYLNEKGGANAAHLQTLAKAIVERVNEQAVGATQAVYAAAGGKAQWDAAAAVFDKSAPAHLKTVIAKLLDSGNRDGVEQASKAVLDYVRQGGLVPTKAGLVQAGGQNLGGGQAMGKAEFQAAHAKLDPNSRTYQQDRNALFARRAAGKQLGQ